MSLQKKKGIKYNIHLAVIVATSVVVNVLLSFVMNRLGMPLYFDTAGTIYVAALGGAFPGIVAAVATNVLCGLFNRFSLYYMLIGILIAIATARFIHSEKAEKKYNLIFLILGLGVISGGLGAVFQWMLLGKPQFDSLGETVSLLTRGSGATGFLAFVLLNIGLNTIDKAVTTIAGFVPYFLTPEKEKQGIRDSRWMQAPLTKEQAEEINGLIGGKRSPLRFRMVALMTGGALLLAIIFSWITLMTYSDSILKKGEEDVTHAAEFAAKVVDADKVTEYVSSGAKISEYDAEGYQQTNDILKDIKESVTGMEYVYVYQIREDGCRTVFDTDEEVQQTGMLGEKLAFDEAFLPYVPSLLAGKPIDVMKAQSRYGYFLTAYVPIYDTDGRCVAYAGADLSVNVIDQFKEQFIINTILAFSGFFVLILGFGLWITGYRLVYPIGSMAEAADGFMKGIDDQKQLDENVKALKKLDIHTGDEVEELYREICEMAEGTAEQMRSIRYLAQSTAKMQNGLIITMADMVENRDSDTGAHIQKTAAYVRIILEGLKRHGYYTDKLTDKFISDVEISAPLHDVGKINVSDTILNKPGKLTDEEFAIMKTHTTAGKKILENAISTVEGENYLKEARNMAAYHHERWDGKGYPEGLKGEVIPLSARVMAIADVFDALTSPRVYKPAFPIEKALSIIQEGVGTQFDPKCVEVFMDSLPEVKVVLKKYQEK